MTEEQASEMSSETRDSVLRRMTGEGQGACPEPSMKSLLRLALEQASDVALGLPLEVTASESSVAGREGLGARLQDDGLFAVLEGQVSGFLAMDCALVGGIVEHQTIGSILSKGQLDRRPTRVDAALVAPFVDVALEKITQAAQAVNAAPWAQGLAFGAMVPDQRTLLLALPVRDYHLFAIDVQIGGGQRQGRMFLGVGELPKQVEPIAEEKTPGKKGQATVRTGVLAAPATLDAVIARLSVPLKELQSLKAGETLVIHADALRRTRLEARGTDHAIRVSLGQLNGFRAVRLQGSEKKTKVPAEAGVLGDKKLKEISPSLDDGPPRVATTTEPAALAGPEVGIDDLDALLDAAEDADVLTPV